MKTEINTEVIDNLASLSKLKFSDDEKQELKSQVEDIISMLDELGEVEDIQESKIHSQKISELREDNIEMSMSSEEVFLNAKNCSNGYFVVPKVVD